MVKKAEVVAMALKAANQEEVVRNMGMMNHTAHPEKTVDREVAYRIATDIMYNYQKEYRRLFDRWYAEGMPE